MNSQASNTSNFILQKVAPLFNRQGYAGTSLSDLTEATGLTKGAIYFNFKNKEDLAVKSFLLNVKKVILPLAERLNANEHAVAKLRALTNYYRHYFETVAESGGCPVLNVGSDANHTNPALFDAVKKVARRLESDLVRIIQTGIDRGGIKSGVNALVYGKNIYAMIEGSVFMAFLHDDKTYMESMMDLIDQMITEKLTT